MRKKHNRKTLLFKVIITLWILTTKQKNTHTKKKTAEQTSAIKCVFRVKVISIFFSNTSHTLIHTHIKHTHDIKIKASINKTLTSLSCSYLTSS